MFGYLTMPITNDGVGGISFKFMSAAYQPQLTKVFRCFCKVGDRSNVSVRWSRPQQKWSQVDSYLADFY